MKRLHLFFALVAIVCFVCSCGEEKATITLYEVENGDTIEVQHEITPSEIQEWLVDGYQFKEDWEALTLRYLNKEEIPSVVELVAFLACYNHEIKLEDIKTEELKNYIQRIHRPVEAQIFVYSNDNLIFIYSIDDVQPQISFGICAKRDGFNEYCEKMKEVDKFSDYNETELQYITMMAFLGRLKSIPHYFTARNFESKSGIISRLMTSCGPE